MTEEKLLQIEQELYEVADDLEAEWAKLPPLSIDWREQRDELLRRQRGMANYSAWAGELLVEAAENDGLRANPIGKTSFIRHAVTITIRNPGIDG